MEIQKGIPLSWQTVSGGNGPLLRVGCAALLTVAIGCSPEPLRSGDASVSPVDSTTPMIFADNEIIGSGTDVIANDSGTVGYVPTDSKTLDGSAHDFEAKPDAGTSDTQSVPDAALPPPRPDASSLPLPPDAAPLPPDAAPLPPDAAPVVSDPCDLVPLHHYWQADIGDSFYLTGTFERAEELNYAYIGIEACICAERVVNTVPLHRFWSSGLTDHLYGLHNDFPDRVKLGYEHQGIEGYIYQDPTADTVPLMRYWSSALTDHHYTIGSPPSGHGYRYDTITGHVLPAGRCTK